MPKLGFLRVALLAILIVLCQATWALASSTGGLTGTVTDNSGAPIAGAKVSVISPSQSSTTTTDAHGFYVFVSLLPDTYTVTVEKDGYDTVSQAGVTVIANSIAKVDMRTQVTAKVLGHVTSTAAASLVKSGTTTDVYSVNAATATKVATLGGGGSLGQAYSAIAAQPGVVVPPGQSGWFQTIHIRGGDFDQVGYEFDGVPVLRSYDNYPTSTASTVGEQELQVYTGGAPANSESQGLAGYINQVIKSGSYPGFANLTLGIGTPTLGNSATLEVGGATPTRSFSYFVGLGDNTYGVRYVDNSNGASYQNLWGTPFAKSSPALGCGSDPSAGNFASCYATGIGPGGYVLGPIVDSVLPAQTWDHESVVNLHFGIPHHADSGRDDVQLLFDNSYLHNSYYSSASDWGVPSTPSYQALNGGPAFLYLSGNLIGYQYLGPVGVALNSNQLANLTNLVNPVYFAYNPASITTGVLPAIPVNQRDGTANPNSIIKLQYQRNIGTESYFRIYGFDNYSTWPQTCPNTAWTNFIGYCPLNYYVQTHTHGVSAQYSSQLNDKNLITAELSDFWAIDYRSNDTTMVNDIGYLITGGLVDRPFAWAVNAANPTNGICYDPSGNAVSCYSSSAATIGLANAALGLASTTLPASCGSGPCEWFVAENGRRGGGNYAKPNFGWASIGDQWKPTDQLLLNLGVRYTRYFYQLSNTGGTARNFWFNAWNDSHCVIPGAGQVPFYNGLGACPAGTVPATMTNLPNDTTQYTDVEPRVGATFTINPDNVLRLNYSRQNQPPNTAYEQYNLLQQDLASYDANNFWPIGFTTTTHAIRPPTANDYDFSWEHRFAGSDVSFKLTPYLRETRDQIQNFFLNQKTNFVSGLNAGNQTSDGVEFELTKGDFNQNGLSALFSFTYSHNYIHFSTLGNGGSVMSTVNVAIQQYNSFTSACLNAAPSNNPNALCGTFGNANAAPTFACNTIINPGCTGTISNPYYNAPAQPLFDLTGNYVPFGTIPGAVEAASGSYETPDAAVLVLNFKHDKFAISPQFQYFEGGYYGDPLTGFGIDPSSCGTPLTTSLSGDPRYPYGGSSSGNPFDATNCGGTLAVPDPYTHKFDNLGAFRQPNQFLMHMQVSYEMSPRVTLTANIANIIDTCTGGSSEPWTRLANNKVCNYILPGYGAPLPYGANIYNPANANVNATTAFQPMLQYPYQENPTSVNPLEAFFSVNIKL